MHALISKLPAFVVPFVTRSLRGGRGRRYLIFSLLLAAMTGIVGLWMTLGPGQLEQSMRTDLDFEQYEYERERDNFTIYVHDDYELERAHDELRHLPGTAAWDSERYYYSEVSELYFHGQGLLERAANSRTLNRSQEQLRQQAIALVPAQRLHRDAPEPVLDETTALQTEYDSGYGYDDYDFNWYDRREVRQLEAVIAAEGIPAVELYRSPLSFGEALAFTGFLAGMLLVALGTVFAPLLVAVQQAQERHENTLMPLTGTALGPRELAMGLASGPASVIAIFAAPQLLLFLVCALAAGELAVGLALVAALLTTSALFMFGAQLLGQLVGHKRTPGVIGIALMSLAGTGWLGSILVVADADSDMAGFSAIIPQIGLGALLAETFGDIDAAFSLVFVGTFVWTVAAALLAHLALTALARKIEGTDGTLLTGTQASIGALVCMLLVSIAFPDLSDNEAAVRQYFGLAMLALPCVALLMARVPTGDGPASMRKISVPRLLLEFGGWAAGYFVLSALFFGTSCEALHPVALGWLAWCVLVSGLLAIRQVSVQTKVAANVWAAFCAFALTVGFFQACMWALDRGGHDLEEVFIFFDLSPVLGLMQVALAVWIPVSLVRHLRHNLGAIR